MPEKANKIPQIGDSAYNYPDAIIPTALMKEANESIEIYNGSFQIKFADKTIDVKGEIKYKWIPEIGVYFSGIIHGVFEEIVAFSNGWQKYQILINGYEIGESRISFILKQDRFTNKFG